MDQDKQSSDVDGEDADSTLLVEELDDAAEPSCLGVFWSANGLIEGNETCFLRRGPVQMGDGAGHSLVKLFVSQLTLLVNLLEKSLGTLFVAVGDVEANGLFTDAAKVAENLQDRQPERNGEDYSPFDVVIYHFLLIFWKDGTQEEN